MKKMIWFVLLLSACGPKIRPHVDGPPNPVSHGDPGPPPRVEKTVAEVERIPPVAPHIEPKPPVEHFPPLVEVNDGLKDAYFAYDHSDLSADALAALRHDADLLCAILAEFPGLKVTLEGHCDERGSAEYNLALGDRRARQAEQILREHGVPAAAIEVVSYGKESPQCAEASESCWQRNRRAHLSVRSGAGYQPASSLHH